MGKSIRTEMKQADVIAEVAEQTELPKTSVKAVMDSLADVAGRHIQKGSVGQFKLLNLVKLERVKRKARTARNPSTGEEIKVPAKRAVKARPLAGLKKLDLG